METKGKLQEGHLQLRKWLGCQSPLSPPPPLPSLPPQASSSSWMEVPPLQLLGKHNFPRPQAHNELLCRCFEPGVDEGGLCSCLHVLPPFSLYTVHSIELKCGQSH